MLEDAIQKRLKLMEERNPSLNFHPKGVIDRMFDRIYFFRRFVSGQVRDYTKQEKFHDSFNELRTALAYLSAWRGYAGMYRQPMVLIN